MVLGCLGQARMGRLSCLPTAVPPQVLGNEGARTVWQYTRVRRDDVHVADLAVVSVEAELNGDRFGQERSCGQ